MYSDNLTSSSWDSLLLDVLLPSPRNVANTLIRLGQEVVRQKIDSIILLERSTLVFGDAIRSAIPKDIRIQTIDIGKPYTDKEKEGSVSALKLGEGERLAIVDEYIALGRQTAKLRNLLEGRGFDVYTYGLGGIIPSRKTKVKIFNPFFRYALVRDIGKEIFGDEDYAYSEKGISIYNYINSCVVSIIMERDGNEYFS